MNAPLPKDALAVAALPVNQIQPSSSNPRKHFDEAYIAELAESIKAHGLIQPITVRPHPVDTNGLWPYEIIVGECRWRAAKLAGLVDIPAFIRMIDDRQMLEIQIIENLQRRDVHPLEEADGYRELMDRHGYKAEEIAAKISKSKGYVYARLKLTALHDTGRDAFFAGQLDASTALLVARISGASLQARAVKEITEGYNGPLSYRNAQNHIRHHFTIRLEQATFKLDDAKLLPAVGSCTACPKRSGNNPELYADLEDADVCTDTACFEDKRMARRDQLVAIAEKKGIKVITGEEAAEFMPHGPFHLNSSQHVSLAARVPGDPQHRTYREILGDNAPVTTLVEDHNNHLIELGEPTALAKALRKAGWQPDLLASHEEAEKQAKREQAVAEREAKQQAAQAENERRKAMATPLIERARAAYDAGELNADRVLLLLAVAFMRFDFAYNGEPDSRLERFGITLPDTSIDDENAGSEMEAAAAAMRSQWSAGQALAYLLDVLTCEECSVNQWNYDPERDQPFTLQDLTALLPANGKPRPHVAYALAYRDEWRTWSGKGKKPGWVIDYLARGGNIDDLKAPELAEAA
jgi:ParB/RepB/Spo0J family partition protein